MSILEQLSDPQRWGEYYRYKTGLVCPQEDTAKLRAFIDSQAYLPVCASLQRGERFPLPRKSVISKLGSEKKRIVFPE